MLMLVNNGVSLHGGFRRLLLYCKSSETTPQTEAEATHSFINYLADSLGVSQQEATTFSDKLTRHRLKTAKKVSDFDSIPKTNLVIHFFKQNEFQLSQIRNIVCHDPRILRYNIDKTLKPKLDFLRELGFSGPHLALVVDVNPTILFQRMSSDALVAVETLREILGTQDNVISFLKKLGTTPVRLVTSNVLPNVALLLDYGIPLESIRKRLLMQPKPFCRCSKYFELVLIRVEQDLGIPRDSEMFLYGIHLLACLSEENINSKCRLFKRFGWTESEIQDLIRRNPFCLTYSEARIQKSLEFFMNELGCEPAILKSKVFFLTCSLEKRIIPRHRIWQVLKAHGLMKSDMNFFNFISLTEKVFLKKFVFPFEEVHQLYAEYTGHSVELLT